MGIRGFFKQVTPTLVKSMVKSPSMVKIIVESEFLIEHYLNVRGTNIYISDLKIVINALTIPGYKESSQIRLLEIEKSWEAIRYILNCKKVKTKKPLGDLVFGKTKIGCYEDFEYSVPEYSNAKDVKRLSKMLSLISGNEFKKICDPYSLPETLYTFHKDDIEGSMESFTWYYEQIAEYYQDASKNGNCIMTYVL